MATLTLGQELPHYELTAFNYNPDSANKIHGDEIARVYGFSGGLVPGVGDYAYMTHPVVELLGRDWLERGFMSAKFLKPVYDGDRVRVRSKVKRIDPISLDLELSNSTGTICAVGEAGIPETSAPPDPRDFPDRPPPRREDRRDACLATLPPGAALGTYSLKANLAEWSAACSRFRDELPVYKLSGHAPTACHPAILLQMANDILAENVNLPPWIHTASEVQNFAIPRDGETLNLRGRVLDSYSRRGHEIAELDLAMFGEAERPIMKIKHSAIVRLRLPE